MKRSKKHLLIVVSTLALVVAASVSLCIGVNSVPIAAIFGIFRSKICALPLPEAWQMYESTIWYIRLPRILLSLLAGAALAVTGSAFQSIFRNPICDPYILGISSGASLGAAIAIVAGFDSYTFGVAGMALVTALLTLLLILAIASVGRRRSVETILLAGVAVNFLISAGITLLLVLHQESLDRIIFWTMGSFGAASWEEIVTLTGVGLVVIIFLLLQSKSLNIIQLGNETAQTSGVNTRQLTISVLLMSALLVATTVACCGVVGFVGLVVPHIVRLLFGNETRTVFTFSLFFGAGFCLIADTLARTIASPAELPVGSITALIGAPYFILLLLTNNRQSKS